MVSFHSLLDLGDGRIAQVAEGTAAGADGVTGNPGSGLGDGVGVAELEAVPDGTDAVLGLLGVLQIALQEVLIDGNHGLGVDVRHGGNAAGAAGQQVPQNQRVVTGQDAEDDGMVCGGVVDILMERV